MAVEVKFEQHKDGYYIFYKPDATAVVQKHVVLSNVSVVKCLKALAQWMEIEQAREEI